MSLIDISELHKKSREQRERKIKIYDTVLQKCHHRIKLVSELTPMNQWCFYLIPKVLFGMPLYNLAECVEYLVKMLSENGFKVAYTHPNLLLITWFESDTNGGEYNRLISIKKSILDANKNKNKNENFKSIDSFKPSGNLIYNQQSLNLLDKKNSF